MVEENNDLWPSESKMLISEMFYAGSGKGRVG